MTPIEVDDTGKRFLVELYDRTAGDTAVTVSMYDIGAAIGLDRDAASRAAEDLIGMQLVEIKTLSGGISITGEGAEEARKMGATSAPSGEAKMILGDKPVIDEASRQVVERVAAGIKSSVGGLNLEYGALSDLIADLKTIDAQMASSRPKTVIIRECYQSLKDTLEKAGAQESIAQIKALLGE